MSLQGLHETHHFKQICWGWRWLQICTNGRTQSAPSVIFLPFHHSLLPSHISSPPSTPLPTPSLYLLQHRWMLSNSTGCNACNENPSLDICNYTYSHSVPTSRWMLPPSCRGVFLVPSLAWRKWKWRVTRRGLSTGVESSRPHLSFHRVG